MGQYSQYFIDLSFSLDASINNMFKKIYFLNEKTTNNFADMHN